jgi:hypothetical protein
VAAKEMTALAGVIRNVSFCPRAITVCRKFSQIEVCLAHLLGGTIFAVDEAGKFREPRQTYENTWHQH